MQRLQPILMTGGITSFIAKQKQRKQLVLTDSKNIFTCRFKPLQPLQLNIMTDSMRKFMNTKHNGKTQN